MTVLLTILAAITAEAGPRQDANGWYHIPVRFRNDSKLKDWQVEKVKKNANRIWRQAGIVFEFLGPKDPRTQALLVIQDEVETVAGAHWSGKNLMSVQVFNRQVTAGVAAHELGHMLGLEDEDG